jgi:4-hydroxy-2-oxoglutarate aldolase
MNMEMLTGVFAPMTTPFKNDEVDYEGLAGNVEKMNSTGLKGYFVLGTNGEFKALSIEERFKILELVVKTAAKDKVIMAGCGAESTRETIELVKRAADKGAKMASVLMPCFFAKKMNDELQERHAYEVADASPIPIVIYNNPSVNAGVVVKQALACAWPPTPISRASRTAPRKPTSKTWPPLRLNSMFWLAPQPTSSTSCARAAPAGVLSLADVSPAVRRPLQRHKGRKNDLAEELNTKLVSLNTKVSGAYGVAGVKGRHGHGRIRGRDSPQTLQGPHS